MALFHFIQWGCRLSNWSTEKSEVLQETGDRGTQVNG